MLSRTKANSLHSDIPSCPLPRQLSDLQTTVCVHVHVLYNECKKLVVFIPENCDLYTCSNYYSSEFIKL